MTTDNMFPPPPFLVSPRVLSGHVMKRPFDDPTSWGLLLSRSLFSDTVCEVMQAGESDPSRRPLAALILSVCMTSEIMSEKRGRERKRPREAGLLSV